VKVSYWPLPLSKNGFGGFPNRAVINTRIDFAPGEKKRVINNEIIHVLQQTEFSDTSSWTWKGYFKWVWTYVRFHYKYGYENNPMEMDSVIWDDPSVFSSRPPEYWREVESKKNPPK